MELAPVGLNPGTRDFYVRTLAVLNEAGVPFLVGGAYALATHAGIERHTKDMDIFVRRGDRDPILRTLEAAGYRTEVTFPHWLAKAYGEDGLRRRDLQLGQRRGRGRRRMVRSRVRRRDARRPGEALPRRGDDLVQGLRSGARTVRRRRHRPPDPLPGRGHGLAAVAPPLRRPLARPLRPPRHLRLHLSGRAGEDTGLGHPRLADRLGEEIEGPPPRGQVCFGTLLSREQYLADIGMWGYQDARLKPLGQMSAEEVTHWTAGNCRLRAPEQRLDPGTSLRGDRHYRKLELIAWGVEDRFPRSRP